MWNATKFEKHLKNRLQIETDGDQMDTLFSNYEHTRSKLLQSVYGEIKGVEPDLTDHSAKHIQNVQQNIHYLLSDNVELHGLSAYELYLLGMLVLFHDVGNIFGRGSHQHKVAEVYDWARGTDNDLRHEKTLILQATAAHTGKTMDGSLDTLRQVSECDQLFSEPIRLRELAAILRLADELSEGPQRTSSFMNMQGRYPKDSEIYHDYASGTNIRPDRGTGRIMVTYEILIGGPSGIIADESISALQELLTFTYGRLGKLDQERRYARYYSAILSDFKATKVAFNFHFKGQLLAENLPPIELDDKVIPGDPGQLIPEIAPIYSMNILVPLLIEKAREILP